jgi:hypothetical protein
MEDSDEMEEMEPKKKVFGLFSFFQYLLFMSCNIWKMMAR